VVLDGEWRWDAPIATPPVDDFGIAFEYGPVTHMLKLTYTATEGSLAAIEVTAKLTAESGVVNEVKLAYESWDAGTEKQVKVPSEKYRSVTLSGKAKLSGQTVAIEKTTTWPKPYRPGISGFRGNYDRAESTTRFDITNGSPEGDLSNVTAILTLTWPDGNTVEISQKFPRWGAGEIRSFTVRRKAPRITLTGTARAGGVEVIFDTTWTVD
jgi:hypothetical protein